MRVLPAVAALLPAFLLAGCAGSGALSKSGASVACPNSFKTGVRLTASVAQVALPDQVQLPSGSVRLIAGVGRRILLSAEVLAILPRVHLVDSSLTLYTLGGTLAGWARIVKPAGGASRESIRVSSGFLRISPFIPGKRFQTYTQAVDVLVVPGGEPGGELVFRPGAMWDDAGQPIAPQRLEFALEARAHMTVLEAVNADAELDFALLYRSRERWECSVQSDFQLVDHESVLPDLWTLRESERGMPDATLALYRNSVGAFPMVFSDPATAAGFARWLGETRAVRLGTYQIGWISQKDATGFRTLATPDFRELVVRQLGSD